MPGISIASAISFLVCPMFVSREAWGICCGIKQESYGQTRNKYVGGCGCLRGNLNLAGWRAEWIHGAIYEFSSGLCSTRHGVL